uniref:Uncharacterized protein n=1 Tax=Ascaris lumbricoides TaxID=6252 RepID=A0A0M3HL10_ASCLU
MEYNLYVGPYLARSTPKRKNVGWEATFPGAPEGKHSAVFMKRVVFALASDLLYRRRLLPPISFKRRQVECKLFLFCSYGCSVLFKVFIRTVFRYSCLPFHLLSSVSYPLSTTSTPRH